MTDKAPERMLPCPFCGGTNLRVCGDDKVVALCCYDCQATGPNQYGRYDWENRPQVKALEAERDKLREALSTAQERLNASLFRNIAAALKEIDDD